MKKNSKFDVLFEDTLYRFQQGGLLQGDIVKIRGDALNNDKIKPMSEQVKAQIKNAIDTDLNLRVASIKSIRPNTTQNYNGYGTDAPADYFVDIVIEYAPGLWREPMTLPLEILERVDTGINLAPVPDSLKRKNKITKDAEIQANDAERTNPKANTKLSNTPDAKDGRSQAPKPQERKSPDGKPKKLKEGLENVYENMLIENRKPNPNQIPLAELVKENITGEDIGEGDIVDYADDDGGTYEAEVIASHKTGYTIRIISSNPLNRRKPGDIVQVGVGEVTRIPPEEFMQSDDGMSDVEADADTLASAGMGTDEDYGDFGGGDEW